MSVLVAVATARDVLPAASDPRAWLSDVDRARHASFRRAVDRDGFVAARVLVRCLLAEAVGSGHPTGWRITQSCPSCARPHGRPRVHDVDAQVSWAHSGDLVAAAVSVGRPTSSARVGVDVERVAPDVPPLPGAPTADGVDAWLRWTRMEALVKCGDGDLDTGLTWSLTGPPAPTGRPATDLAPDATPGRILTDVVARDSSWVATVAASAAAQVTDVEQALRHAR